jgi:1-acyl-sn-glycerol-3-phosphate acyltransferase
LTAAAAKPAAAQRGPVLQFVGSLLFTGFLFAWTFLYAIPFVVLCLFLPFPRRYALVRIYAGCTLAVLRWCCGLTYQVEGSLPQGAHVAFWKHSSSWETIAMMVVFPRQVWVLKRELMWIPVVGQGIWLMHAIAIDRKAGHSAVSQVVEQGRERLAEGDWVIIFPEGTRMPPGETRRYGMSGTLLAQETGRLIVPVAHNAGSFWPRRGLLKKPGTVRVIIGPPVSPQGRNLREVNEELQTWVERTVQALPRAEDLPAA